MKEINFYSRNPIYGFFSNFHRHSQVVTSEWGTHRYPTNEHYYQAMKANNKDAHDWVASAPTPFQAMKAGRALRKGKDLRNDWDDLKLDYMLTGLRAKFSDEHLRTRILETGDAILHEDSPTDMFWGKKGNDWLGRLLMQVRDELRNSEQTPKEEEK